MGDFTKFSFLMGRNAGKVSQHFLMLLLPIFILAGCINDKKYTTWNETGGTKEHLNYSALNQIDTSNVHQLQVAWVYHSEDSATRANIQTVLESNPIVIDRTLFAVSPTLKLFAIDAVTGKEIWKFNPFDSIQNATWFHRRSANVNRGVNYWSEGDDKRIIFAAGSIVYAVDATTGKLIRSFGKDGGIELREGLDRDPQKLFIAVTSPVMIYKNMFYVGGLVGETTPGFIRAFDVKTGVQKWIFHTIPRPGETGYDTWDDPNAYKTMGSTNSWGGFTLDEKRGILFAPTGTPTNDFYGGKRAGNTLFGSSLVALDANTGKLRWYFQNVHHDVWDKDLPAPPALMTLKHKGKKIDIAVQTTKTGFIFVFDRETGKPIFPIEERIVPVEDAVPGEKLSPTQPFPMFHEPYARQILSSPDLNPYVDDSIYQDIKKKFESYTYKGMFTPPTENGTIIFPGVDGGGEWSGPAIDPATNMLYINSNQMAWVITLVRKEEGKNNNVTNLGVGKSIYKTHCMSCHGAERKGAGDYPSLLDINKKYSPNQFYALLSSGRGMMPGFNQLGNDERKALASFILDMKDNQAEKYTGTPIEKEVPSAVPAYGFKGYERFITKDSLPAISPPWGLLTAINLTTGKKVWQIPFGEFEELKKKGIPTTGRENYGAPVVTAGGLLFIGATGDNKFRAINKYTGKILFETTLPASANSTPAVYSINGKQYVVIACGGSKTRVRPGKKNDTFVAFTLPN